MRNIWPAFSKGGERNRGPGNASSWAAALLGSCAIATMRSTPFSTRPMTRKCAAACSGRDRERSGTSAGIGGSRARGFRSQVLRKEWPDRSLYNLMMNTTVGDEVVTATILRQVETLNGQSSPHPSSSSDLRTSPLI